MKSETLKKLITAANVRIGLSIGFLVIIAGSTAGFNFGISVLQNYATTVSHTKIDAKASNNDIKAYQKLQQDLADNQDALDKANMLRATNEFPEFRIVDEVKKIANKNHVKIESFSYGGSDSSTSSSPAGAEAAPVANAPAAATTTPAAPAASGKTVSLTVSLKNPVNYKDFLQFLYDIGQVLPKMQVSGVGISPAGSISDDSDTTTEAVVDTSKVSVEPLVIQMYTK